MLEVMYVDAILVTSESGLAMHNILMFRHNILIYSPREGKPYSDILYAWPDL